MATPDEQLSHPEDSSKVNAVNDVQEDARDAPTDAETGSEPDLASIDRIYRCVHFPVRQKRKEKEKKIT
jgi:hypothetical protein